MDTLGTGQEAAETSDETMRRLLARARQRIETLESGAAWREPVAIVGLACRFPGAPDAAAFWANLVDGVDAVGPPADGRWDVERLVSHAGAQQPGRMRTADGGFLDHIRAFDAAFFGISGREAEYMDPQQRLLLETCWHGLEDAGIQPARLSGTDTGVFVGISSADYGFLQAGSAAAREAWAGTGNALSIAANRISYALNLNGPSLAVDTACSSSLVAVHQAVRAIRLGECGLAVAGGVNVLLNPDISIAFSQAGMLSPTGRCRTFDAASDGYVRSEGVGVVILKRLKDALRDGDPVRAVIAGSAVNQDGRGNGLTAPNGPAQQAVIRAALRDADATPGQIAYVEAHGTGTPLGDPIELNSLAKVMEGRVGDPVLVGAVKAAIGHTEAAAGMAGLIKTVLAMEAGVLPAQPHLTALNPRLKDAAESIVTPVRAPTPWPVGRDHAGVSAFGFGGTNAHVVLRRHRNESTKRVYKGPDTSTLTLSARSEDALRALALKVAEMPFGDPCDLAASLAARRTAHAHRLALPVRSDAPETARHDLRHWAAGSGGRVHSGKRMGSRRPRLVFAFSGQGAQKPGMGRGLYETSERFRAALDRMSAACGPVDGAPLTDLMFGTDGERLARTEISQPAIFALQVALTADLDRRGIRPDTVMGYSLGEYTAACIAGALPAEAMANLVARRGALFASLPEGAMLSVQAPAEWVAGQIAQRTSSLAVAARISEVTIVVAGDPQAIERLRVQAEAEGYSARPLRVSRAFHSPMVDPILPALGDLCAAAGFHPLERPLISNLDGTTKAPGTILGSDHWMRHSRVPVEYARSLASLAEDPTTIILEIGPSMTLTALGRANGSLPPERFVATLTGRGDEIEAVEDAVAQLVALGIDLGRDALGAGSLPGSALPLYPFDRTVHWLTPAPVVSAGADPFVAISADPALPVSQSADTDSLHSLFASQLDLVRRTIASQLAAIEPLATDRHGAALSDAPSEPATPPPQDGGGTGATVSAREPEIEAEPVAGPDRHADVLRMRPAAELIWMLAQKSDDASRAYHIPVLMDLTGDIDPECLRGAVEHLLARHEALRATFPALGEMRIGGVGEREPDFEVLDGRDWPEERRTAWLAEFGEAAFDLANDRLLRVRLLRTGDMAWSLCLEAHHLVTDGLSTNLIVGELASIYNALRRGGTVDLPPAVPYRDWLDHHQAARQAPQAASDRAYWIARLGAGVPPLDLPCDGQRGLPKTWRGNSVLEVLQPAEATAIRAAARALGLTPFMLHHAVLALALARYAGQTQVAIATPTSGRPADLGGSLIGYCSDLMFSLVTIDANEPLQDYCRRTRSELLDDLSHSAYSFAWIAEELRATGADLPLQIVFNYQNAYVSAPFEAVTARVRPRPLRYLDGELTLNTVDIEGHLALELNYADALYGEASARSILDAYSDLLRAVAAGARGPVGSLPLVGDSARARLDALGRGEERPAPETPLGRRIERIARERPDAVAVRKGNASVTYGDLDVRANALAHRLLAEGLSVEGLVGLHLPRSIDLVVAQLAVAKAGGAFLVLDRRQPADWRRRIVRQAGVALIVGAQDDLSGTDALFIDPEAGPDFPRTTPAVPIALDRLMYVIFTSGSTGEPKGVMIEHGSVANYIGWLGDRLEIGPTDRILQFAALGFDASIEEIYTALAHGATLVLRDDDLPADAAAFWNDIAAKQITVLDLPTAYWHGLTADKIALGRVPSSLRHVILGGEAAKPAALARWQAAAPRAIGLWNTYGPTETTIVCTAVRLDGLETDVDGPVPIGTPVANTTALVLDSGMQPLPPGAIGTLYVGGAGVARGYLGRPDLTAASFVTLPGGEGRFYRTGDRVRWRPDGLLDYRGREDGQIKLRGFRIEAGEIEKTLERHGAVGTAAVVAQDVDGVTRLAAFVVPASEDGFDRAALRADLMLTLPDYMVPQAFVLVPSLPIGVSGKVDRQALPAVDWPAELARMGGKRLAPLDAHEETVAAIWADVLGLDPAALTPESDFFAVGGDSLLAMQMLPRLASMGAAAVSARDLFRTPRLGDLAKLLAATDKAGPAVFMGVPRIERDGPLPLGPGQRRLWFLHHLDPARGTYNLPSRIDLDGPLDLERVRDALAALVARHESLRCRFADHNGEPMAVIDAEAAIPLDVVDLSDYADADTAIERAAADAAVAPFVLDGGPLVRATLFRRSASQHVLVLCAHHAITDGWSMAILGRDFASAYAADPGTGPRRGLPPLDRDYFDYAAAARLARSTLDEAPLRAFWQARLGDLPELLELPTDRPRPDLPNGEGRVHRFALPQTEASRLRETAARFGVTPFAILVSVWGLLLARLSGQAAFALGTVIANRDQPGAQDVAGFFADTLALRFDVADEPTFAELCRRSRHELVEAMAHAALPFEAVVEQLVTDRTAAHSPIFQAMFVWQNTPAPVRQADGLVIRMRRLDKSATQFDLVLDMTETANGVEAMLEYRTQLFDPLTIERLAARFRQLLSGALDGPEVRVGRIPLDEIPALIPHLAMPDIAERRVDAVLDHWVDTRPDGIAVVHEAEDGRVTRLSWAEFGRAASAMAAGLQAHGIDEGDAVAICAGRSPDLLVAIYAVLKAGAAYVPLDPSAPAERQRALVAAARARLIVTEEALLPLFGQDGREPELPFLLLGTPLPDSDVAVRRSTDPSAPIYIIFTSGTTGTPKGVVVPHRGVANMALGMGRLLGVGPDDSLLQFAPLNFDASALQIFVPMLAGGTCVLHHEPGRLGASDFMDLARRHGLTMLDLPAALWRQWVDTMSEQEIRMAPSIRIFFTGGEALCARTMRRWAALCDRKVAFLSSYGPTEASITATAYVSDSDAMADVDDGVPDIGRPLPNVSLHVLDLFGLPAAPGTIGEIAIGGPGVADGYLDDTERTAAVFVERPGIGRVYLTGDYGRLTERGTFEFHGRRDAQIKIRGFRIEPAEVESAMLAHPAVAGALVIAQKGDDRRPHLVAYAVPARETAAAEETDETLVSTLRAHLEAMLPGHMVPAAILVLPALPLLPTGKVDRRALPPVPVAAPAAQDHEPPLDGAETLLAAIWRDMLKLERVGRSDNFFELGGDSILSLQLAARARRAGLAFEVRDVFRAQTLAALAAVARTVEDGAVPREAGGRRAAGARLTVEDVPLATVTQAELDRLDAEVPGIETVYDASFGQAGMLFHALLAPETGSFLIQTRIDFSTALDVAALKNAVADLVARHPVLRTSFRWDDRELPLQLVQLAVDLPWDEVDLSAEEDETAGLDALAALDRTRPLDLSRAPLMRMTLARRRGGWTLVWLKHHAVIDGWSMPLLYDDLVRLYAARTAGQRIDLPTAPGFDRYVGWLRDFDRQAAEHHWGRELSGFAAPTELPLGRGTAAETGEIGRASTTLGTADFGRLMALARRERVTLGTLVMGAFAVLLSRYSGTSDVLTTVTVSGRPHDLPGAEGIVGMFLNALPLRTSVSDDAETWPWLRDLQELQAANDALGHLGLLELQRFTDVPTGQRLSETLVIVQNTPLGDAMSTGLGADRSGLSGLVTGIEGLQKTGAPLTLFAEGRDRDLTLTVQYDAGRYDACEMAALVARLARILGQMAERPRLGDLALLAENEEAALIARSAGPSAPPPDAPSLIALFERQVATTPGRIALFDENRRVTYAELDAMADCVGAALVAEGVRMGDVVALLSGRSLAANAALLGIMKAGAAFLVLDPAYPPLRLADLLEDSQAVLLLHAGEPDAAVAASAPRRLSLDAALAAEAPVDLTPTSGLVPDSLAYLIYTSGSTGRPKGVRALHRGALNRLDWMWREMPFADGEVMVQKTALSFVDSIWEIFGPLLAGVPSLVLDEASVRDVPALLDRLAAHRVSRLVLVPTLLKALLDLAPDLSVRLPHLLHWISSGETLPANLVAAFRRAAPGRRLVNLYGSSEVAGDVTWFDTDEMPAEPSTPVSLGRPIDNCAVYLRDAGGRLVPDGVPGELWIGGAHVAAGYHGRPELSADAFRPNPYGAGLLFRSRDWGRRETDGTITFFGRQDGQVKIRGMRVDLAEVEAAVRATDGLRSAVVLDRPGADGRSRIVCWYAGAPTPAALRSSLQARLPNHMLPAAAVCLEALPLLPNGKIDRRALPDPDDAALADDEIVDAPATSSEKRLAAIWADVLGLDPARIGRAHSYFQLGGDSISAIRVATRTAAGGLPLAVRDIFETANLAELAARIDASAGAAGGRIPLGPLFVDIAPERWRRFRLTPDPAITVEAARRAIDVLVARHDLLGARIDWSAAEPALVIGLDAPADGTPIFLATIQTATSAPAISLSGHPLLLDAAAWAGLIADLRLLLAGRDPVQPAASAIDIPPILANHGGPIVLPAYASPIGLPPWTLSAGADTLRAGPDDLVAAAAMRAFAGTRFDGAVAVIVADRPDPQRGIATARERAIALPTSSGDPLADLRAAKTALRSMEETLAAPAVTVRLIGVDPSFADLVAEAPALALAPGSVLHFELLPDAANLQIWTYEAKAGDAASLGAELAVFAAALEDYQRRAATRDASVWVDGDFPLAALKPGAVATLADRFPRIETIHAVTPGQMGMIVHSLADPESAVYGLHTTLRLAPGFNREALEAAFAALIARHPILRTSFDWTLGDAPVQIVHRTARVPLTAIDWRDVPDADYADRLADQVARDRVRPIDLDTAPAMRATLTLRGDGGADLLWSVHHAIVDGWSLPLLLRDLIALHDRGLGLPAPDLPDPPDFADHIRWLARRDRQQAIDHWKGQFAGLSAGTDLVAGRGASAETGIYASRTLKLPADGLATLLGRARLEGVTVATLAQGAWAALLARYNQAEEQVFGVTVSGRAPELAGIEDAVGPFVNVLPLRLPTRDDARLWDWFREAQRTHAGNDRHNHLSFAEIQALTGLPAGERLCDSMLVVQNFPMDGRLLGGMGDGLASDRRLPGLSSLILGVEGHQTTSYALTLFVLPQEAGLEVEFLYDTGRFDRACIDAFANHFANVLSSMADAATLSEVDILSDEDEDALLALGRGPETPEPQGQTVLALFEARAAQTPEATALLHAHGRTSYAELEEGANRLAAEIIGRGHGAGTIVAIHMDRSRDLVIALLAVMKAGAAWLPLDPAYPAERLAFMVEDSGAALILHDGGPFAFQPMAATLDVPAVLASARPDPRPLPPPGPADLAYLIYTSGSTGRPKGVRALHRGLLARLSWSWRVLPYADDEVAVMKTALPFVDSVAEIFGPLGSGVPLVIVPAEDTAELDRLVDSLERHCVTWIVVVPSLLRTILDMPHLVRRLGALRTWIVSGEACTAELVARFRRALPQARLLNFYGSSEVAGDVTFFDTARMDLENPASPVPIGRPIDRSQVHILDRRLKPMPLMLPGELYVGGDTLADGYHDRPELTAEAFRPNPFGEAVLFRTRDWARWTRGGLVEFLGRQDGQVKVRGMRVEIGEVEAVLKGLPGVDDAVVRPLHIADGTIALAAYWAGAASADAIRDGAGLRLAAYMVPQHWTKLPALPLLPNGKIDRKALPDPLEVGRVLLSEDGAGVLPEGLLETLLAPGFAAALGRREGEIGATQDFFALGGHSLAAARILAGIAEQTGVTLRLRSFYEAPSLRAVAARVEAELLADLPAERREVVIEKGPARHERGGAAANPANPSDAWKRLPGEARDAVLRGLIELRRRRGSTANPPLLKADRSTAIPATLEQEVFLRQRERFGDRVAWTIAAPPIILDEVDPEKARAAIVSLARRHEVLHTTFRKTAGRFALRLEPDGLVPFAVNRVPLTAVLTGAESWVKRRYEAMLAEPFDAEAGPLWRAELVTRAGRGVILTTFCSAIVDGESLQVIDRDLRALLAAPDGADLPDTTFDYGDYAYTQSEQLRAGRFETGLEWWRNRLAGGPPALWADGRDQVGPSPLYEQTLSSETGQALDAFAAAQRTTPHAVLLTEFLRLLRDLDGTDDLWVASATASRDLPGTEGMVGTFARQVLLRFGWPAEGDPLAGVHAALAETMDQEPLPHLLVKDMLEAAYPYAPSAYRYLFNHRIVAPAAGDDEADDDVAFRSVPAASPGLREEDILLMVMQSGAHRRLHWYLRADRFDPREAERLLRRFQAALQLRLRT